MNNSKIIQRRGSRSGLLTTVSSLALFGAAAVSPGFAGASGQPALWIDIGLHTEQVRDSEDGFALPFGDIIQQSSLGAMLAGSLNLSKSYGDDAKIAFRPDGTDWVFSASVRYGRAHGKGHVHQSQTLPSSTFLAFHSTIPTYPFPYHRTIYKPLKERASWVDADTVTAETHYIVDFEAGKDVGLGLFGHGSVSTLGVGVRFANFASVLNVSQFHAKPDVHLSHFQSTHSTLAFFPSSVRIVPWYFNGYQEVWHNLAGNPHSSHSFRGIGPEISWDASAPLWGDPEHSGVSLDWSLNAAVLFGKQKNKVQHQTVGTSECYGLFRRFGGCPPPQPYQNASTAHSSKNVTVPNVGGSIGVSYRLEDFKVNFGYRADFFLHVLDTGLAGQHASTRGFTGPYASVSIGVGD